jgi:hypothetical protein
MKRGWSHQGNICFDTRGSAPVIATYFGTSSYSGRYAISHVNRAKKKRAAPIVKQGSNCGEVQILAEKMFHLSINAYHRLTPKCNFPIP